MNAGSVDNEWAEPVNQKGWAPPVGDLGRSWSLYMPRGREGLRGRELQLGDLLEKVP